MLGDRYAGVYGGVLQHVPRECVIEGAKMAKEVGADILVALGGTSPSDAAKGMNLALTRAATQSIVQWQLFSANTIVFQAGDLISRRFPDEQVAVLRYHF